MDVREYIKYDRNPGVRGGWGIAVSICNSDVMVFSKIGHFAVRGEQKPP